MDALLGLLILAAIIYAIVRRSRGASPPRTTTERPAPLTSSPGSRRPPSAAPRPRDAEAERDRRRQTAEDGAFFEGVLFAHYFLHDRDDPQEKDPLAADADDPWAAGDAMLDDDAFHDDFGDW